MITMKRLQLIAMTCIAWAVATGCISKTFPPCLPLSITLTVKDKNYFNIDDAAKLGLLERKDETLPFRAYVHSLYYILHDATGNIVAEQRNIAVASDSQTLTLDIPSELPYGEYTLTVWGNMDGEDGLGENAAHADMEANDTATNDIYLGCGTFDYRYGNETHTLALERTKGNLLIKAEGLPDNIDFSTKNIDGIYGTVDSAFGYSLPTNVATALDWTVQNDIQTQTLMCPSLSFEGSTLNIVFFDKSQIPSGTRATSYATLEPQDVNITVGRNEITILRYVYTELGDGAEFDIFLRVNGNWELLHHMQID